MYRKSEIYANFDINLIKVTLMARQRGGPLKLEIALNRNSKLLTRKQRSRNQEIPSSYLVNILISLKAKGIIKTNRGPHGGYELARKPEDITIFDIVEVLEGPFELAACLEDEKNCSRGSTCVSMGVWTKVQKAQGDVLRGITINDLVEETQNLYSPDFSI